MAGGKGRWGPGERPIGRAKGTPNKLTGAIRSEFERVFVELQQRARKRDAHGNFADKAPSVALIDVAQEHPIEFYKLMARIMPHELSGPGGAAIPIGVGGAVTVYHIPDNGRGAPRKGNGGNGNG